MLFGKRMTPIIRVSVRCVSALMVECGMNIDARYVFETFKLKDKSLTPLSHTDIHDVESSGMNLSTQH